MPRIRPLPDDLISQIAAGEVVERPASVVKELVENALDAGAHWVEVELEAGGKRRIRVTDDGGGMDKDDALLAFDRHATSKIGGFADLERVATLGFRGEALATIAAVARVEMVTAEQASAGWRVRLEGGRVRGVEPAARARGTTVDVASLFFNVPARRKFLKAGATELRRATEVVQGYALAQPEVGFALRHEERLLLEVPAGGAGEGGRRQRIGEIFGHALAERLLALPEGGGGERIGGFVGRPDTSRGRRSFVFVNGRLIRDRAVLATFYRAVREAWRSDEFPSLFLFLEVPPGDLDVNVHPQKAEVRFRDPRFLDRVGEALREALGRGRGEAPAPLRQPGWPIGTPFAGHGLGGWGGEVREGVPVEPVGNGGGELAGAPGAAKLAEVVFEPGRPVPLSGPGGENRSLRYLGQYKGSLLLVEAPDGLLLVDQHAAHERVLYERLAAAFAAEQPRVQRLLVPRLLDLAPAEAMALAELAPHLTRHGFALERLSGNDWALGSVPAGLGEEEAVDLLTRLAARGDAEAGDAEALRRGLLDGWAAAQACKGAIKIHHPLGVGQVEELVAALFRCRDPWACPHGRPTVLKMGDAELERRFGRR